MLTPTNERGVGGVRAGNAPRHRPRVEGNGISESEMNLYTVKVSLYGIVEGYFCINDSRNFLIIFRIDNDSLTRFE